MVKVLLRHPEAPTPRARYAALLLFDHALGLESQWVLPGEITENAVVLDAATLPLQQVFDLVTRADAATGQCDVHGRPIYHYPGNRHKRPAIHDLALEIARTHGLVPRRTAADADFLLTWDLDLPFRFAHKPWYIQAGSALKNLLKGDFQTVLDQIQVVFGQKTDPFDTYDRLMALSPVEKTRIFLQLGRHSAHDTRHPWPNTGQKQVIDRLSRAGYTLGLHPSYHSSDDPAIMEAELGILQAFKHSRQHFLRYREPATFRQLQAAGVQYEYSIAMSHDTGFPTGMAVPYPWYDLEKEQITDLVLIPGMVMDRTLLAYLRLSPDQALAHASETIRACQSVGGLCVLILHNDSLSNYGEWRGWIQTIIEIIEISKKR